MIDLSEGCDNGHHHCLITSKGAVLCQSQFIGLRSHQSYIYSVWILICDIFRYDPMSRSGMLTREIGLFNHLECSYEFASALN